MVPGHPSICIISEWCLGARDWAAERAAQVRAVPAEHAHLPPAVHPLRHHTHILLLRQQHQLKNISVFNFGKRVLL